MVYVFVYESEAYQDGEHGRFCDNDSRALTGLLFWYLPTFHDTSCGEPEACRYYRKIGNGSYHALEPRFSILTSDHFVDRPDTPIDS